MRENIPVHQAAQRLVAVSIAGLEKILEQDDSRAMDTCFGACNYLSKANFEPASEGSKPLEHYKELAGNGSRPYRVAEAFEQVYAARILKDNDMCTKAVKNLIGTFPRDFDISNLVKCAQMMERATTHDKKYRELNKKLEQVLEFAGKASGKAVFYEGSAEEISRLVDAPPLRLGFLEKFMARKFSRFREMNESFFREYLKYKEKRKSLGPRESYAGYIEQKNKLIESGHPLETLLGDLKRTENINYENFTGEGLLMMPLMKFLAGAAHNPTNYLGYLASDDSLQSGNRLLKELFQRVKKSSIGLDSFLFLLLPEQRIRKRLEAFYWHCRGIYFEAMQFEHIIMEIKCVSEAISKLKFDNAVKNGEEKIYRERLKDGEDYASLARLKYHTDCTERKNTVRDYLAELEAKAKILHENFSSAVEKAEKTIFTLNEKFLV